MQIYTVGTYVSTISANSKKILTGLENPWYICERQVEGLQEIRIAFKKKQVDKIIYI